VGWLDQWNNDGGGTTPTTSQARPDLPLVGTFDPQGVGWQALSGTRVTSNFTQADNEGHFYPLSFADAYSVVKVWWTPNGVPTGNVDIGLYTLAGVRIASIGSTAWGTAGSLSEAALSAVVGPGVVYIAIAQSVGLDQSQSYASGNANSLQGVGIKKASSVFPLPAGPVTLLDLVAGTDNASIPKIGVSSRSLVA